MENILRVNEERINSIADSLNLPHFVASDVTLVFRLMTICLLLMVICLIGMLITGSLLYLLGSTFGYRNPHLDTRVHVMIIAGSGGHTTEVLRLVSGLSQRYYPRTYVIAETDTSSEARIRSFESAASAAAAAATPAAAANTLAPDFTSNTSRGSYQIHKIPRSREVRQSWLSTIFTTIFSLFHSIPLILYTNPDLVICNGPGTCIPICLIVKFVRLFRILETKIIFVESICRVRTLSLSGKILYHAKIADEMIVQWPELKSLYPNTKLLEGIV